MGALDGDVRELFAGAFADEYHDAVLHRGTASPVYGTGGKIIGYTDPGDVPAKAQINRATNAMRRADGYAEGDVAIIILASGLGLLNSDMTITIDRNIVELGAAVTYRLESAELDAAASNWMCRGRKL